MYTDFLIDFLNRIDTEPYAVTAFSRASGGSSIGIYLLDDVEYGHILADWHFEVESIEGGVTHFVNGDARVDVVGGRQ